MADTGQRVSYEKTETERIKQTETNHAPTLAETNFDAEEEDEGDVRPPG